MNLLNCNRWVSVRITCQRTLFTQANIQSSNVFDLEWSNAKHYSEIPGPSKLQMVKAFMPSGKFRNLQFDDMCKLFRKEYGNLVKLPGMFGKTDKVLSFNGNDFEKVLRADGSFPIRPGFEAMTHYRKTVRRDVYSDSIGLGLDQGEPWWKLRTVANPILLKPKNIQHHIPSIDAVALEFVNKIKTLRDVNDEMPDYFAKELSRWGLESIGTIALDQRLGALRDSDKSDETQRLINAAQDFFKLTYEFEVLPSVWKYYKTKNYHKLIKTFEDLTNLVMKYVEDAAKLHEKASNKAEIGNSVLKQLLKIDRQTAMLVVFDMLVAGIDTTFAAATGLLYNLAKNPEKQEILRDEILKKLPNKFTAFHSDSFNNMSYIKACLKESLRVSPVVPHVLRTVTKDIILGGYQIPKNTEVLLGSGALPQDEEYFPKSNQFIPERWLKTTESDINKTIHPFVYLPFGHGIRYCIGKRIAEMEIEILASRILQEFRIEWNYGKIKYFGLVNSPISPLKFKFINL